MTVHPSGKILFVDISGSQPLPSMSSLAIAGHSFDYTCLTSATSGIAALSQSKDSFAIVVLNQPDKLLLEAARRSQRDAKIVLLTSLTMEEYSRALGGQESELLDHVIANIRPDWAMHELRIVLQKLRTDDIFGVEKYLLGTARVETRVVKGSCDRDPYNQEVAKFAEACGFGKNIGRMAYGIAEEMMMNAIYDAPVAGGRVHYDAMPRSGERTLQTDEWVHLRFGSDGNTLALSIEDPFGAFRRDKFFGYLKKVLRRNDTDNLIDTKQSGAGLGLFKILYNCHALVCNVKPGKKTEVIALIDLQQPIRDFGKMARSIHYFVTDDQT